MGERDRTVVETRWATLGGDGAEAEVAEALAPGPLGRFVDLGLIGIGGMGEVRRVRDPTLNRVIAMKILRGEISGKPAARARFLDEAEATAQLQHPGIVPVHEIGTLADGRPYFTMREVRGRRFDDVIADLHAGPSGDDRLRRVIELVRRVAEAVGYAHTRGVVHRDLKPTNLMIGEHGDVLVMDWGLVKVRPDDAADLEGVVTSRSVSGKHATRMGFVAGTPAYMSPEQARGEVDRIDARTDVWALGILLYEVLVGELPFDGPPLAPDAPPVQVPVGPEALREIVDRALALDPTDRPEDASRLAAELGAWLDGSLQRERALGLVAQADLRWPSAEALRWQAAALRAKAGERLAAVPSWAHSDEKLPAWRMEDEAERLEREAELAEDEGVALLYTALDHVPGLAEAHLGLAARYRDAHEEAEAERDVRGASLSERRLRHHVSALPVGHVDRIDHERYLSGDGSLTLLADPPTATFRLSRFETVDRRLVAVPVGDAQRGPLVDRSLPLGSWMVELSAPGHVTTRYPVAIGRRRAWDGVAPGETSPRLIRLPRSQELGVDDVFVPPGWYRSGGDGTLPESLPSKRIWVESFVIRRYPVTMAEFLEFLDDLVARGQIDEAMRHRPRDPSSSARAELGCVLGPGGRFRLVPDPAGDVWGLDWPVFHIDWFSAVAYADWLSVRTGRAWRLPAELEWEKAARGVDGRVWPWGDKIDASWFRHRDSHPAGTKPLPGPVGQFADDCSPYGVRDLGGGMRDWCADPIGLPKVVDGRAVIPIDRSPDVRRIVRGGDWFGFARNARCAYRIDSDPNRRFANIGFRIARSV